MGEITLMHTTQMCSRICSEFIPVWSSCLLEELVPAFRKMEKNLQACQDQAWQFEMIKPNDNGRSFLSQQNSKQWLPSVLSWSIKSSTDISDVA